MRLERGDPRWRAIARETVRDLAQRVHALEHSPASPELRHLMAPFDDCSAEICEQARELLGDLER